MRWRVAPLIHTREYLCKYATNLRILPELVAVGSFAIVLQVTTMTLHAAAVEILIEKARFEPAVAVGFAEAIEATIMHAQFVTVPIFDARLQELKAEARVSLMSIESKLSTSVHELKSDILRLGAELETRLERTKVELVRWVFLVMLGNVALTAGATAVLNAFRQLG
jgi:hypothetical protein